jgi:hypothetical protein
VRIEPSIEPGLPASWTRAGVYLTWLGITAIGAGGLLLVHRGFRILGNLTIAVYAALGMDSLGHSCIRIHAGRPPM